MASCCYIHIPFCQSICDYCDFYRVLHNSGLEKRFVIALIKEIKSQASNNSDRVKLKSLYVGGGTPSLLSGESWRRIVTSTADCFVINKETEFTIEANPESVNETKLALLADLGVNRISLGVQSFDDTNLKKLGRIHDSRQVSRAVELIRGAGIENLSIDLIFGLPGETDKSLRHDLAQAAALEPEHISLYALTLEGDVPLRREVVKGELLLPEDDTVAARYIDAVGYLRKRGYAQYEISNFSRQGRECIHSLNYWSLGDYYAFGPAAVRTLDGVRVKNDPDIEVYTKSLSTGELPPADEEQLDQGKRLLETIFLSLRLTRGLDTSLLKEKFGYDIHRKRRKLLIQLQESSDLTLEGEYIRLTTKGLYRSDLIASHLCPDFV